MERCGAKRRNGEPCRVWPVKGRNRCRLHGGRTLVGAANGTYKDGRYSRYLPERMAAQYRAAKSDPELLSLKDEVAALDARIADLFLRVDTGESGAIWEELQREWAQFHLVRDLGDVPKMHVSIAKLDRLFARRLSDYAAWAEIASLWEQRRKLAESEHKRLIAMRQMITQEQALLLMGAVTDVITRNVPDKQALSQIIIELQQIMTRDQVPVYAEVTA
jgi:hypothetical protein